MEDGGSFDGMSDAGSSVATATGEVATDAGGVGVSGGGDTSHVLFTFEDSVIFVNDLESLQPGRFVTDQVINYCFEKRMADIRTSGGGGVLYVCPSTSFFIGNNDLGPGELSAVLEDLRLSQQKLILLPVNDADSSTAGGTHWSLLAYWNPGAGAGAGAAAGAGAGADGVVAGAAGAFAAAAGGGGGGFFFFDSMSMDTRCVSPHAQRIANNLAPLVESHAPRSVTRKPVVPVQCPQQANGSDCALHLLGNATALEKSVLLHGHLPVESEFATFASPAATASLRSELAEDIRQRHAASSK